MSTNTIKRYKSPDGTIRYVSDNKLHNPEGPALIHPDGKEEYYVFGIQYSKDDFKKIKKCILFLNSISSRMHPVSNK